MELNRKCPSCGERRLELDTRDSRTLECFACGATFDYRKRFARRGDDFDDRDDAFDDGESGRKSGAGKFILPALLVVLLAGVALIAISATVDQPATVKAPSQKFEPPPFRPWTGMEPPPGWSIAPGDRFACLMPGIAALTASDTGKLPIRSYVETFTSSSDTTVYVISASNSRNRIVGKTEEELIEAFRLSFGFDTFNHEMYENQQQSFGEFAGMPCVRRTYDESLTFQKPKGYQPTELDRSQQHRTLSLIFGQRSRLYVLTATARGKAPDEEPLELIEKTFKER